MKPASELSSKNVREPPEVTWMLTSDAWPSARWSRGRDFTAFDGELLLGRVYQHQDGPQKGLWFWTMPVERRGPPFPGPTQGIEERQGDAGRRVAEAYWALLQHVDALSRKQIEQKPDPTGKPRKRKRRRR